MKLLLLTLVLLVASLASMVYADGDAVRGRFDAEAYGRFEVDERDGRRDFEIEFEDQERFAWRGDDDRRRDEVDAEGRRPGCDKCRHCCGRKDLDTCCHCPRGDCGPEGFPGHPGRPGRNGRDGRNGITPPRSYGQVVNVAEQVVPALPQGVAFANLAALPDGLFVKFDVNGLQHGVIPNAARDALFVTKPGSYFLTTFLVPTSNLAKAGAPCTLYVNNAALAGGQYSYQLGVARSLSAIVELKAQDKLQLFCAASTGTITLGKLARSPATAPQTANANLVLVAL